MVLLCPAAYLEEARASLGTGVNRVVTEESVDVALESAVRDLLDIAPRVPLHAPAWISLASDIGPKTARCATENLSTSGMLVTANLPFPVGSSVTFRISIPDETTPIRGTGLVSRTTDLSREGCDGFGVSFQSFMEADRSRLKSIVRTHLV